MQTLEASKRQRTKANRNTTLETALPYDAGGRNRVAVENSPNLPNAKNPTADYGVGLEATCSLGQKLIPMVVETLFRGPGFNNTKFQRSYCRDPAISIPGRTIQVTAPDTSCRFPPPTRLGVVTIRR